MSSQKALCLICERPTADGAIYAAHVDKEKLQEWFLNVCGYELDEQIKDEDTICYFCAWQAEFLWEFDGMSDEDLVWWPRNLDLDDAARELRKYYFEGKIEQCWVQLEKVKVPQSEEEEDTASDSEEQFTVNNLEGKKCFYCGNIIMHLSRHVTQAHKNAIRCENRRCATYFHTFEEREKHNEEVHEKPSERKTQKCNFCSKKFTGKKSYKQHVRRLHREFLVKCAFMGCLSFFKTKTEMRDHFDSLHKINDAKMHDCEYCEYKTRNNSDLQRHIAGKHGTEKTFNCDECGEMFSTKNSLTCHTSSKHVFKRCKICSLDISVGFFTKHIRKYPCFRCKNKFQCSGLYQLHLKKCREILLKCSKCPKSFKMPSLLVYHMKRKHGKGEWRGLEHKALGFKCEPCKRYYKSAKILKQHSYRMHNQVKLNHCAHCPKSFSSPSYLKNHIALKHNLLPLEFECDECKNQFFSKLMLRKHFISVHLTQ